MRKHPYEEPLDPTEQIHQAGDRNDYQNFPLFDFHKTINPTEESPQEEDFPEDFQEVEDSPEEEDSLEEGDIQEEEEYHWEDHQEAVGDHHRYPCPRRIKENW